MLATTRTHSLTIGRLTLSWEPAPAAEPSLAGTIAYLALCAVCSSIGYAACVQIVGWP